MPPSIPCWDDNCSYSKPMPRLSYAIASAIICSLSLCSCHDTVDSERIPYAPVHVDLSGQGTWDTYGVHAFGQGRKFIRTGNSADQEPKNFHYSDLSATGFGGLLLVGDLENMPLLYDLACPVERKQSVRV